LQSVGARPVVRVDGRLLVDYLLPDAPKGYDIADYYLSNAATIRPDTTAEIPQSVELDLSALPDVDLELSALPDVELDLSTLQVSPVESIDYSNIDALRSSLLRAFGDVRTLPLDELNRRLEQGTIAGGRQVVSAANSTKPPLLNLRYVAKTGQYYADLEGRTL
jgi:hypothetical protein